MRIRHKILLGYVALISVAVALVIFFLVTLSDVTHRYNELITRDRSVLMLANDLRSNVQRQIVAVRTYEQIGDLSLRVEYNDAVHQEQVTIEQLGPYLTADEDRQTIEDIKQASQSFTQIAQEMMDKRSTTDQTSQMLRQVQSETARLNLVNTIDRFLAQKNQQVEQAQNDLKAQADEVSTYLLVWSLVGVIGSLIGATLLTESITAPLRRLMRNIQGISSGDLHTAVAVRSRDEVGEVASVLETMRQRLASAASQNESLLRSAREEAEKLARTRYDLEVANAELQEALETELEARRQMEEIDRLKAEFTSMVSHELKTPVSYVYNYAGALKEHGANLNDGQRTEFLTAIQGEAQHLITLIDDIMAISLLEAGGLTHRFVETDLRKLTDSVVRDQQLTTRRHTVTIRGPEALSVRADPTRLRQVLNNLLSNAIKYSPQGGSIEVRLRQNAADSTAMVYVRDHGIGVDPADVPKLFDRFSRIQNKQTMAIPGSGLGLYIAHHIIQAHGGNLTIQPAPGGGTLAEVSVPLFVPSENEEEASAGEEVPGETAVRKRIRSREGVKREVKIKSNGHTPALEEEQVIQSEAEVEVEEQQVAAV